MSTTNKRMTAVATTMSFQKFWTWLQGHVNCIVRAGTPEAVLFDHEDFHWTVFAEDETTFLVQVARAQDRQVDQDRSPHPPPAPKQPTGQRHRNNCHDQQENEPTACRGQNWECKEKKADIQIKEGVA